jgi:hypothetical protein
LSPPKKWDSYLAHYAASLPNAADRAGIFTPAVSFWDRMFGAKPPARGPKDVLFPEDDGDDVKLRNHEPYEFQQSPAFLKKGRSVGHERFQARMGGKKRGCAVKFRPVGGDPGLSSDEDEEGDPLSPMSPTKAPRPWLRQKMSMASTTTLVDDASAKGKDIDFDKEMGRVYGAKKRIADRDEAPEYSDYEEDVTNLASRDGKDKEWSPGFLKRHRSGVNAVSSTASQRTAVASSKSDSRAPPLGAVPATPSLIKALDRIAVAQKDAFSDAPADGMPAPGSPQEEYKGARWGDFWKDVKDKAR